MIPLFKSDCSLGKSILKIKPSKDPLGPDSIIDICTENGLKTLVLVEDNLTSFMTAVNECKKANIQLIFGLRISCVNDISEDGKESEHKIIVFARNDNGCKLLNRLYSRAHIDGKGRVDFSMLHQVWSPNDLELSIPFYDSFLFNNTVELRCCIPDFSKITPTFFVEDNDLPFDAMIRSVVMEYIKPFGLKPIPAKSIYYKKRSDYRALQAYKIICNRQFGKNQTLDKPELLHFGSPEFCWESYESATAQV